MLSFYDNPESNKSKTFESETENESGEQSTNSESSEL